MAGAESRYSRPPVRFGGGPALFFQAVPKAGAPDRARLTGGRLASVSSQLAVRTLIANYFAFRH